MTKRIARIEERGCREFADDRQCTRRNHDPVLAAQIIGRQHPRPVRVDATQVSLDHVAHRDLDDVLRHAPGTVDFGDLLAQRIGVYSKNGSLLWLGNNIWTASGYSPILI